MLFRAYAPGGTSVVSDSDYLDATVATAAVDAGGIGTFSATTLQKAARREAGVGGRVHWRVPAGALGRRLAEGSRDADAARLSLVHRSARGQRGVRGVPQQDRGAPRESRREPARPRSPTRSTSRSRSTTSAPSRPPRRTWNTCGCTTRSHSTNSASPTRATSPSSSSATSTRTKLKPLVEQYLASLPSTHAAEKWKDVGHVVSHGRDHARGEARHRAQGTNRDRLHRPVRVHMGKRAADRCALRSSRDQAARAPAPGSRWHVRRGRERQPAALPERELHAPHRLRVGAGASRRARRRRSSPRSTA